MIIDEKEAQADSAEKAIDTPSRAPIKTDGENDPSSEAASEK